MNQASLFSPLLEQFFSSDKLPEDALDLMESHGFLTALNISPTGCASSEWLPELFGLDVGTEAGTKITDQITDPSMIEELESLKSRIHRTLYSDSELPIPCELTLGDDPDESDLRAWCIGFLAAHFLHEESWYERDEQLTSELLLPIFVISGLFEEESQEFAEMAADSSLVSDMCQQLPQVLTELYLHYQAPEEKPGFKPPATGKASKKQTSGKARR